MKDFRLTVSKLESDPSEVLTEQSGESTVPITDQHSEEMLSVAYVYAVAAQAGMNVGHQRMDYGIDVTVSHVSTLSNGKRRPTGYDLHLQLKSSINISLEDEYAVYDLEAESFNTLAGWNGPSPCYLVVMRLPREIPLRLHVTEDLLSLRDCCYWHRLELGVLSKNKRSERIRIPRYNRFTPEALVALMDRHRNEVHK